MEKFIRPAPIRDTIRATQTQDYNKRYGRLTFHKTPFSRWGLINFLKCKFQNGAPASACTLARQSHIEVVNRGTFASTCCAISLLLRFVLQIGNGGMWHHNDGQVLLQTRPPCKQRITTHFLQRFLQRFREVCLQHRAYASFLLSTAIP